MSALAQRFPLSNEHDRPLVAHCRLQRLEIVGLLFGGGPLRGTLSRAREEKGTGALREEVFNQSCGKLLSYQSPQKQLGNADYLEPFSVEGRGGGGYLGVARTQTTNYLVSWARLRQEAELRASVLPPHHRHLPADTALNRYVVTRTHQALSAPSNASPFCRCPSPTLVCIITYLGDNYH